MLLLRSGCRPMAFLAGLALILAPQSGYGQGAKPQKVRFNTFDDVEIHGSLFSSAAGGNAPCVLLLHEIGGNTSKSGLEDLAKTLQASYNVLMFDFRGHGDSTDVGPMFWNSGANRVIKGANQNKTSISFKDFPRSYYPMLVNDICAARLFLDRENNAGRCNSSNIIVIGAGDGATLGALWITAEWQRRAMQPNPLFPGGVGIANGAAEGKDIACAVWLSMSATIPASTSTSGGMKMPIAYWFTQRSPDVRKEVPMSFICGEKDFVSRQLAQNVVGALKTGKGPNKVSDLTGAKTIQGTSLKGTGLLKSTLDTDKYITKYLETVVDKRGINAAEKHTVPKTPSPVPLNQFIQLP